jgi:hypothetical protein
MMSANCQYCGKKIIRKLAADLKRVLEGHVRTCPERPKGSDTTQQEKPKPEQKPQEDKKMVAKTGLWDEEAWNGATQGNFAAYDENGIADVIFTDNDFEIGKPDKWGRTPYEFAVIQNQKSVVLSVASIRLMHALKQMLPLEGKRINIIRSGSGMDTTMRTFVSKAENMMISMSARLKYIAPSLDSGSRRWMTLHERCLRRSDQDATGRHSRRSRGKFPLRMLGDYYVTGWRVAMR